MTVNHQNGVLKGCEIRLDLMKDGIIKSCVKTQVMEVREVITKKDNKILDNSYLLLKTAEICC